MRAANVNGNVSLLTDSDTAPTGASILNSKVTIKKEGSTSLNKSGIIENVRNNNVVVNVDGTGYRTYKFDDLTNA